MGPYCVHAVIPLIAGYTVKGCPVDTTHWTLYPNMGPIWGSLR